MTGGQGKARTGGDGDDTPTAEGAKDAPDGSDRAVLDQNDDRDAPDPDSDRDAPDPDSDRDVPDGDEPAEPLRPELDENGMERPRFLLDFPLDPDLELLITAFERGNYAYVRENADKVAAATQSEAVREAALELRRRIEPDPLAKYLLWISIGLLLFFILWAYAGHDPGAAH